MHSLSKQLNNSQEFPITENTKHDMNIMRKLPFDSEKSK